MSEMAMLRRSHKFSMAHLAPIAVHFDSMLRLSSSSILTKIEPGRIRNTHAVIRKQGYHSLTSLRRLLPASIVLSVFVLAALTAVNGKSLKMVTSWFNPKYEGQTFHKVLVIGVARNLEVRADFEDGMAAQIARPGMQTIPGNQILLRPDAEAKPDLDYLRAQIRENQIDAVVVSRLLKVDTRVTSIPSSTYIAPFPYYYSFYGYLGAVYPVVYDPGYTREDTTVMVETNVYATSKPDGDLVWTGVSESFNPKSAKKVADGLIKEVPKQMEKDGLLSKNPAAT